MIGFSGTYYSVRPLFSRHSEGRSSFSLSSLLLYSVLLSGGMVTAVSESECCNVQSLNNRSPGILLLSTMQ